MELGDSCGPGQNGDFNADKHFSKLKNLFRLALFVKHFF